MKKSLFRSLIVLTVSGLFVGACQPAAQNTNPPSPEEAATPESGVDLSNLEVQLDPALLPDAEANAYVYESLLKVEEDQTSPVLALEGTVSEDGLDYIISLRPGVQSHDGTVLNADAVIANFTRWFDPESPYHGSGTYETWVTNFGGFKGEQDADGKPKSNFDGIEKVDELTVLVHLNNPDPEFLMKLADPAFAIVSTNALETPGFGTSAGVDGGTGPYTIGAFNADSLTLEPYPDYWNPNAIAEGNLEVKP